MTSNPFYKLLTLALLAVAGPASAVEPYNYRSVAINGGGYVTGLVHHPAESGLLYSRTDVGGAYRRDTANNRWIPLNDDLTGYDNGFNIQGVLSIAIDPTDANRVYLACGQGTNSYNKNAILRSSDRGATWSRTNVSFGIAGNSNGRGTGERLSVNPFNPLQLVMGTSIDGLWKSEDRGATWAKINTFAPFPPATPATAVRTNFVLHDPLNTGVVYTSILDITGPSLWRSNDGGVNWASVVGQPSGLMAMTGKFDAAGTLYLTFANAQGPNGASAGAVWKLANAATTITATDWTNINPPSGQGGYCGISLDPQVPGKLVVSTIDRWYPRDNIFLSTNGGTTWTGILDGAARDLSLAPWATLTPHWISDVEIDPFDSNTASFVTGFGIFTTRNLNVAPPTKPTWIFSNAGLEETVPTAVLCPASGAALISTIKDFGGYRHTDVDVAPSTTFSHGGNDSVVGAGSAPAVMVRIHATGSISRDGGITWTDFPTVPPEISSNGNGNIALSADGARILWCPDNSAPYWSDNDGLTWAASTGTSDGSLGNIMPAGDAVTATDFYLLDTGLDKILRSTDGGVTFTTLATVIPTSAGGISGVPGRAGELWINGGGISRLYNSAATITKSPGINDCQVFGFGRASNVGGYPAIYLWGKDTGNAEGIYRSTDTGATWLRINDDAHRYSKIRCITGDPNTYGRVYFGTSGRGVLIGEPALTVTNLAAIAGDGSVSLTWDVAGVATSFKVKRSLASGGPYTTVATPATTSAVDGYLVNLTTYYYVVSALSGLTEGANSDEVSARPSPVSAKLTGTSIGTPGSYQNNAAWTFNSVFDGILTTYFDALNANGEWAGKDLGASDFVITQIKYCPRAARPERMNGGRFQGANLADFSDAVTLYTISGNPTVSVLTPRTITNNTTFRYVRYISPNNGYCNVAEVEFYGWSVSANLPAAPAALAAVAGDAKVSLTWNPAASPSTYRVSRGTSGAGPFTPVATGLSATAFNDTGVTNTTAYFYVVSATNFAGSGANSAPVAATPHATMASWQQQYFNTAQLANPLVSGPGADANGDEFKNLLAYAFNASPWGNLAPSLPTSEIAGGYLTITFIRRKAPTDVTYTVEVTGDLAAWDSGPTITAETAVTPLDADTERVTVRDNTPSSATQRFIRVKVQ